MVPTFVIPTVKIFSLELANIIHIEIIREIFVGLKNSLR